MVDHNLNRAIDGGVAQYLFHRLNMSSKICIFFIFQSYLDGEVMGAAILTVVGRVRMRRGAALIGLSATFF